MGDILTRQQQLVIRDLPSEWRRRRMADGKLDGLAAEAAGLIVDWVKRYDYSGDEQISTLLHATIGAAVDVAAFVGERNGHEEERRTNPALRAFGEVLGTAMKAERLRLIAVARTAFNELTASGASNPYHAFNQAMEALEKS